MQGKFVAAPAAAAVLTTASGLKATLLDAAGQRDIKFEATQQTNPHYAASAVFYKVRIALPEGEHAVPNSPLTRRYHLPVVSWSTSTGKPLNEPYFSSMTSTGSEDPTVNDNDFFPPLPVPAFIDIPVDITQRAILGSHHVSVIAPVDPQERK